MSENLGSLCHLANFHLGQRQGMSIVTLPEVICDMSLGSQGLTCFVLVDGFWNHNPLALPVWSEARRKHWSLFCAFAVLAGVEGLWTCLPPCLNQDNERILGIVWIGVDPKALCLGKILRL